jgi:hypothetical protein
MSHVSARLRRLVVARASGRCEYCGLAQAGQEATFHIDHIVPESADGRTEEQNLALACVSCSLRKEARRSAIDPHSRRKVALFHPRRQKWSDHFRWGGLTLVGITPTGRATVAALQMNRRLILGIREEEVHRGRHPRPSE